MNKKYCKKCGVYKEPSMNHCNYCGEELKIEKPKYEVHYDIEYGDGTSGHGSHGEYTYTEAKNEIDRMKNRKYESYEVDYAPMYFNFSIERIYGGDNEW